MGTALISVKDLFFETPHIRSTQGCIFTNKVGGNAKHISQNSNTIRSEEQNDLFLGSAHADEMLCCPSLVFYDGLSRKEVRARTCIYTSW